jgi:hypothetical protein
VRCLSAVTVAALAATAAACSGGGSGAGAVADARAAQRAVAYRLHWVGASFEGLRLTAVLRQFGLTTFIYGTCKPRGESESCTPPLEVQVASICDRNALVLDVRPRATFHARGVPVLDYGESRLELASAASQIIVTAAPDRARRAIAALRPIDEEAPSGNLAAPRYPRYYLAELRRVHDAYARTRSMRATRAELHISQSAVRFQLALADELGAARVRRGSVSADTTLQDVKRQAHQPPNERSSARWSRRHTDQTSRSVLSRAMPDNGDSVNQEGEDLSLDQENASIPRLTVERRWVERSEDQWRRRGVLPRPKVLTIAMVTR